MSYDTNIEFVSQALDAALMRQTAIANNIANANTPDYQTIEVNFEQQIQTSWLEGNRLLSDSPATAIKPFYQLAPTHSSIDEQMALSIKNATHYRALIKGLNQKLSIMKLALQGNNQ